jgi:small-conductance mechanosensitive channel/CRP-like cAMP-binding protein
MDTGSLSEILHIGSMTFGVSIVLGALLLVVHFFTRHMANMLHRIAITSAMFCLAGTFWHVFHPVIHPELKKIDVYINSIIWILAFFSAAYLINKTIDRYVWNCILVEKGQTLSTSFLRSIVAGTVYAIFILLIMLLVFKKEFHMLATFVTGYSLLLMYAGTDVVKEIFAGLALNINPAFKKGDFLQIKDQQAKIIDISWRYVILEDTTANLMFVPNTEMLHHTIYNYSSVAPETRREMSFHVPPNVPPQLVIEVLMPKLKQLPNLAKRDWYEDNITIHIKNCDGHSIEFVAEILIDCFENLYETKTIAYKIIWYTLSHHHISLFSYDMRVSMQVEEYLKTPKKWHPALTKKDMATLFKKSFLFAMCSESEITTLINHAVLYEFVPSQHLYSEGDEGDVLFLIQSGTAQLTKKMPSGDVLVTKLLNEADAVGVNAVMTGQKRERSAIAVTHVRAYIIHRDILKQIVDKYHPRLQHIADQIVYEEQLREKDFQVYLAQKTREEEKLRKSIVGQIREFLGITNGVNDAPGL